MSAYYEQSFDIAKPQIKVETDIIVVYTHVMLTDVGFRCLVTNSEQGEKKPSTFLPKNWNENSDKYSLRYILGDEAFVMIGTVVDENIILNLLSEETLQCTAIAFSIKETVKSIDGATLVELVPNYKQVSSRLDELLIAPFRKVSLNDSGSSTSSGERERRIGAYRNPGFESDSPPK
ncbi:proteasome inhibitor PI31 subunit-like [Contarinia nasturtii]|uniref:proteasome inhibitor PI31 subunit-like n=1 Tax=Contarinia nasturtii TaxID=265458 RepID=UPI0012D48F36|nr:proteasome inhibitor PI31 subunit-like [Contarinia nasturtii]